MDTLLSYFEAVSGEQSIKPIRTNNIFLLLQVLVEYDGIDWQRREWVAVYSRRTFRVFLVERTLVWAPRTFEGLDVKWPALVSINLVLCGINFKKGIIIIPLSPER